MFSPDRTEVLPEESKAPRQDAAEERLRRRDFFEHLARGAGCLALAAAGPCLSACTVPVRSYRAPAGRRIEIPLASFPELERPGGKLRVESARGPLFVRRRDEGFDAISAVCTHQGFTVRPAGDGFRCPLHGSTFDDEGRRTGGPARRPLAKFPVERRGGALLVDLGEEVEP
jgi:Rieske Fe-S protein